MIMNEFCILCQDVDMDKLNIHDLKFFPASEKGLNFFLRGEFRETSIDIIELIVTFTCTTRLC